MNDLIDRITFSSLFVGMGLAMLKPWRGLPASRALSVPFSSGWALRCHLCRHGGLEWDYPFSSLFVGMGLAILAWPAPRPGATGALSVPFSSGWALRSDRDYRTAASCLRAFSSLFVGMGLAITPPTVLPRKFLCFQFPFRRDGPCDHTCMFFADTQRRPFSSLFVGMGLAICLTFAMSAGMPQAFSSLFVGMGLAISSLKAGLCLWKSFQFPFRRDGPCDLRLWPPSLLPRP